MNDGPPRLMSSKEPPVRTEKEKEKILEKMGDKKTYGREIQIKENRNRMPEATQITPEIIEKAMNMRYEDFTLKWRSNCEKE